MKRNLFLTLVFVSLFAIFISGIFCELIPVTMAGLGQNGDVGGGPVVITLHNPLGADSIPELLNNIVKFLRDQIAPTLLILVILFGAFQMLFAGGSPEKFKKGKQTILYSVIAYIIIWVASGVTSIIESILTGVN